MRIILKENQYRRLFEAASDQFSFDTLKNIRSFKGRIAYCVKELGNNIGGGTSRKVFEINEETVLKLAINGKGIAQNEQEASIMNDYVKSSYSLFPKVYDSSDIDNYFFIVSENVLPAIKGDFKKVTGFNWNTVCRFIITVHNSYCYPNEKIYVNNELSGDEMDQILDYDSENSGFFNEFQSYLGDYQVKEVGDFLRVANWGMTLRNGDPYMVILDDGLTTEIFNKFYRR